MKAKGPAAAKVEEEKKKGLALFGPKPPTPKLLRAFGGNFNKMMFNQSKVSRRYLRHTIYIITTLLNPTFLCVFFVLFSFPQQNTEQK